MSEIKLQEDELRDASSVLLRHAAAASTLSLLSRLQASFGGRTASAYDQLVIDVDTSLSALRGEVSVIESLPPSSVLAAGMAQDRSAEIRVSELLQRLAQEPSRDLLPELRAALSADIADGLTVRVKHYQEAVESVSMFLARAADTVTSANLVLDRALFDEVRPHPVGKPVTSLPGSWQAMADALAGPVTGVLYLGGKSGATSAADVERSLEAAVATAGLTLSLGEGVAGSWWRPFKTAAARRLGESDLDTLKRAAEVQLLDRHESQSAKAYAEAIAALASAVEKQDFAYLFAKNVLLVKTIDAEGRSIVASRVLTSGEVILFERGELNTVLSDPDRAMDFVRQVPAELARVPDIE